MFDFSIVTTWIDSLLRQTLGLGDFLSILIECVLVGVAILTAYALIAIVLIFMERKVCAYFQCRLGPMRVGPWGIFQVFADVLKQAQELGYAEADPTFDVEGHDAGHKITIMSALAFGTPVNFGACYLEGISKLDSRDIQYAGLHFVKV